MKLTCFAIEDGKLTKGQRWRLLMPNKQRERSVFRTDGRTREDVVAAGLYVAAERGKSGLHGWVSSMAQVFREQGLEVVHEPIDGSTLACEHYNVLC